MIRKNFLPTNKKMKIKNQISEYYAFSSKRLINIICEQLINKKSFNSVGYREKKSKNLKCI